MRTIRDPAEIFAPGFPVSVREEILRAARTELGKPKVLAAMVRNIVGPVTDPATISMVRKTAKEVVALKTGPREQDATIGLLKAWIIKLEVGNTIGGATPIRIAFREPRT